MLLRFGEHKSIEIKAETCLKSFENLQFGYPEVSKFLFSQSPINLILYNLNSIFFLPE